MKVLLHLKRVLVFLLMLFVVSMVEIASASMSYDEAIAYQQSNSKEVYVSNKKIKDIFNSKNMHYMLNLYKKNGNTNEPIALGDDKYSAYLNLGVDYGTYTDSDDPHVFIQWKFLGSNNKWFYWNPSHIVISYTDGTNLYYPIQDVDNYYETVGVYWGDHCTEYRGRLVLSNEEFSEIYSHGEVYQVYVSSEDGTMNNFFYESPKQLKERAMFNKGIQHAAIILQIDGAK